MRFYNTQETLYSPSSWSKRLSKDVIVQEHVRVTTDISRQVRASIKYTTHYYGQGSNEKLDIFQEKAEAPILVYFSGGYWQELSGDISAYPVRSFHEENVTVIVVHYDRAPKGEYEIFHDSFISRILHYL